MIFVCRRAVELTIENTSEWLNEVIFKQVIKNHLHLNADDYKICSIDTQPATKPGDNYMSIMLRSKLEIETNDGVKKSLSYITKCLLSTVFNEQMVRGYAAFPKETKMYSQLIPAFEKLYENVGVSVQFAPKLYFSTDSPTLLMVMEDLADYKMVDRKTGLDREHVERTLKWLGKFHAASMVHHERNGDYGDMFKEGVYARSMSETYEQFHDGCIEHYLNALRTIPNGVKFAEKVEKWRGKLFKSVCKTIEFDPNALNVLNHGDVWINNLLFSYDDTEQMQDLKVVDHQLPFWGSVAQDIYNFMMSSWRVDFKVTAFDELIEFYFNTLLENLILLRYGKTLPSLEDLKNELTRRGFIGEIVQIEIL